MYKPLRNFTVWLLFATAVTRLVVHVVPSWTELEHARLIHQAIVGRVLFVPSRVVIRNAPDSVDDTFREICSGTTKHQFASGVRRQNFLGGFHFPSNLGNHFWWSIVPQLRQTYISLLQKAVYRWNRFVFGCKLEHCIDNHFYRGGLPSIHQLDLQSSQADRVSISGATVTVERVYANPRPTIFPRQCDIRLDCLPGIVSESISTGGLSQGALSDVLRLSCKSFRSLGAFLGGVGISRGGARLDIGRVNKLLGLLAGRFHNSLHLQVNNKLPYAHQSYNESGRCNNSVVPLREPLNNLCCYGGTIS